MESVASPILLCNDRFILLLFHLTICVRRHPWVPPGLQQHIFFREHSKCSWILAFGTKLPHHLCACVCTVCLRELVLVMVHDRKGYVLVQVICFNTGLA